ncbi:hypothetical protein [Pararhizobium sp.]|uniref:hypothetical protein n=1 Tax=Pararhizobium sp. TaxID=1977563 RepID=UPI003D0B4444
MRLAAHPEPEADALDTPGYANQGRFGFNLHDASINFSHSNLEQALKITSVFSNAAFPCYGRIANR